MVRLTRTVALLFILDHNIGNLVDVNRKPSDGSRSRCLSVLRAFITVTTFVVVSLLVGMIVNFMQDAHSEEADQKQIPIVMRCWCDLR